MNINKNNYEAYFLDYHEGNLSPQEVAELFLFLAEHPELKRELEDFENVTLDDIQTPVFENKESLKKNITPDNREDYFIRAVEGNLNAAELMLLQTFLTENPEFLKEYKLFQKTKLQADPALVFENKQALKQLSENDVLLISAVEGLLNKSEKTQLEKELAQNTELKKEYRHYQHTKLTADASIVFADKQKLKRKERRVVPLFYYVSAVAATVAFIIGLFFMFRTQTDLKKSVAEQKYTTPSKTITATPLQAERNTAPVSLANVTTREKNKPHKKIDKKQSPAVKSTENIFILSTVKQDDHNVAVTTIQSADLMNVKSQIPSTPIDLGIIEPKQNPEPIIANAETKPAQSKTPEYSSIGDLFTRKLKEKLVGKDNTENNNSSKLNGWDVAVFFAKGLTNLTGKKIAIKPQYNKEGEVTAYAFSAGKIEFSHVK